MRKSAGFFAAVAAAASLGLAACGGGGGASDDDGGGSDGKKTSITVGVMPIVDTAAIYIGDEQGFFEDEGLDLKLKLAQGGAAITPAVVSGDYEFGFSNVTSLLVAASKDVPVKMVSAANFSTGKEPDIGAVVVPKGSDIKEPADLAGKTVAVNTLNNIGDSTIRNVVEKDGGDPSGIKFTEMGFPDMPAAVTSKKVDAAWILEPHLTLAENEGAKVVSWNFKDTDPDLMISAYFTSKPYAAEHPKTVEAFKRAMKKSLDYAEKHPDETRAVLDNYTEIDDKTKQKMSMPRFLPEINDSVDVLADLALKYDLVDGKVDTSELLP